MHFHTFSYSVDTGLIHNPSSARVSIPSIVVPSDSPLTPTTRANSGFKYKWRTPLRSTAPYWNSTHIPCHLIFSIHMLIFLSGWFPSLSSLFLALRSARLLVLAGAERLDTTLMVGQMQGKFWLEVMTGSEVGHLVHEVCLLPACVGYLDDELTCIQDDPTRLAEILADFWKRNERVVIRGNIIKGVGEV
jgi:protein phosphatase methylesterase 1